MRNYTTSTDFASDETIMDSIESDGKIWLSYIKDPKSVKTKYRERPKYDHNAIEPNTTTLPYTGGTLEFNAYLIEPQSELSLKLPGVYYTLYPNTTIKGQKISELHYKFTLTTPIPENIYNNEIVYPFYITGDAGTRLAICPVSQSGAPYNTNIQGGYIRGTVYTLTGGETAEILSGASVIIEGQSSTGVSTGTNGKFELQVPSTIVGGELTIQISKSGNQTVTMLGSTEDELNILLI